MAKKRASYFLKGRTEALARFCKENHLQLPKIVRTRHKYEAGYVVGFAGSKEFSGAPKLAGWAALRAGAGIVRIFHRGEIGPALSELICNEWNEKKWEEELQRAKAVFVGPGLGDAKEWMRRHLKKIHVPAVFDADALLPGLDYPEGAILTPHRGEALRLLGLKKMPEEEVLFKKIRKFCKKAIVVLKGAPTFVFLPGEAPVVVPYGDPGMATAGTGDVLTGILAALLAQGMKSSEAAVLGVVLHGMAGELAAEEKSSYSMIASDVIEALPKAFQAVIKAGKG